MLKEGPLAFDAYEQVNVYHIEKFYGTGTKQTAFLEEMLVAMKGEGWYCNDDLTANVRACYLDIHVNVMGQSIYSNCCIRRFAMRIKTAMTVLNKRYEVLWSDI